MKIFKYRKLIFVVVDKKQLSRYFSKNKDENINNKEAWKIRKKVKCTFFYLFLYFLSLSLILYPFDHLKYKETILRNLPMRIYDEKG